MIRISIFFILFMPEPEFFLSAAALGGNQIAEQTWQHQQAAYPVHISVCNNFFLIQRRKTEKNWI